MNRSVGSKKEAIRLRKLGKSYNEINQILGIPKSTLSYWLKELPLSRSIKKRNINRAKIIWAKNIICYNKKRSSKYQKETEKLINKFSKAVPKIDKNSLFWIGLALFWAEGGKREKWTVRFANSDPEVNKIMMRFFREICQISNSEFRFRIHLHPNIDDKKARNFWAKTLKISEKLFYKSQTTISRSSESKRKYNQLPFGTLHIYIGDSLLVKKLKGWIKGLKLKI